MNLSFRRSARRYGERGQSLVLFAMSVLLVTVMVMMTLSFGMRAKEKIELQNIADAAAYSNAVQTARTLNLVALTNRAEVAHQVAMAGTISLISWSTMYIATLNGMKDSMNIFRAAACLIAIVWPPCVPTCSQASTLISNIDTKITNLMNNVYQDGGPDEAAGTQTKTQQSVSTAVHQVQRVTYLGNTYTTSIFGSGSAPDSLASTDSANPGWLFEQRLTNLVATKAMAGSKWPNEVSAPPLGDYVSIRETGTADDLFGTAPANAFALSPRGLTRELGVKAAMGSRGYSFVSGRSSGAIIAARIMLDLNMIPPNQVLALTESGSGRWVGPRGRHSPPSAAPIGNSGDDEGTLGGCINCLSACPAPFINGVDAWVYGSDCTQSHEDTHEWTGGTDPNNNQSGCAHRHTQGECSNCPGVWTMFIDLNPSHVSDRDDHLYGQPKNYAALLRDYSQRCGDAWNAGTCAQIDPWNMFFNFRFTSAGQQLDMRGQQTTFAGLDITKQSAVAAGLAYYHRHGHWREPPNFFNPFWRATLVGPDIDAEGDPLRGGTDLNQTLSNIGDPNGPQVVNGLKAAGYKGW